MNLVPLKLNPVRRVVGGWKSRNLPPLLPFLQLLNHGRFGHVQSRWS